MRFKYIWMAVIGLSLVTASSAFADGSHSHEAKEGQARVGELHAIAGKLETAEKGPFEVRFQAVRLEDGAQILSMSSPSADGSYKFSMQFFDGAEHEVTVSLVNPATKAVITEKKENVEVQAFHPPAFIKFKTLAFLMIVIALGMVLGVWMARWKKAARQLKGGHSHVASV